jgi:hypothetical protein
MDRHPMISAFVLALVGILAGPASQATAAQGVTLAAASPVATGDFSGPIDIGGRKLYLECRGQGSPTVILEAGAYGRADVWSRESASRWRADHGPPWRGRFYARLCR